MHFVLWKGTFHQTFLMATGSVGFCTTHHPLNIMLEVYNSLWHIHNCATNSVSPVFANTWLVESVGCLPLGKYLSIKYVLLPRPQQFTQMKQIHSFNWILFLIPVHPKYGSISLQAPLNTVFLSTPRITTFLTQMLYDIQNMNWQQSTPQLWYNLTTIILPILASSPCITTKYQLFDDTKNGLLMLLTWIITNTNVLLICTNPDGQCFGTGLTQMPTNCWCPAETMMMTCWWPLGLIT